jgi:hypothetical protein
MSHTKRLASIIILFYFSVALKRLLSYLGAMKKKNIFAVALGMLAKGRPKTLTKTERARRSAWMKKVNAKRRRAK